MEQQTEATQEVPQAKESQVEVLEINLGDAESFTKEQVQDIVQNALKSEIVGLKSNNQALKDEKKKVQDRLKEYNDLVQSLGGE